MIQIFTKTQKKWYFQRYNPFSWGWKGSLTWLFDYHDPADNSEEAKEDKETMKLAFEEAVKQQDKLAASQKAVIVGEVLDSIVELFFTVSRSMSEKLFFPGDTFLLCLYQLNI